MSTKEGTAHNNDSENFEEYEEYTETSTADVPVDADSGFEITEDQLNEWENEAAVLAGDGDKEGEAKDGGKVDSKNSAEVDSRSVFVGNVDYSATVEDLTNFFKQCGEVVRVTIPVDRFTQQPKAFAYVEFDSVEAAGAAVYLSDTELNGRPIKVQSKRTNIPQFQGGRGRGRGGFRGGMPGFRGRGRGGFMQPVVVMPYGFAPNMYMGGGAPRGRGRGAPRGGARGGRGRFTPH